MDRVTRLGFVKQEYQQGVERVCPKTSGLPDKTKKQLTENIRKPIVVHSFSLIYFLPSFFGSMKRKREQNPPHRLLPVHEKNGVCGWLSEGRKSKKDHWGTGPRIQGYGNGETKHNNKKRFDTYHHCWTTMIRYIKSD